ncbi:uncharacterized protein LOC130372597 [Gadus chalcogrammus]|uniref:uncharacterized protein LOC130372597 n=1 Tax=Gadus chalcogrammus TaxID=1042646 RepID=UPI0024C4A407|nr:uncharacterized protein LOC130372597 [Gadus chalcogrammus]
MFYRSTNVYSSINYIFITINHYTGFEHFLPKLILHESQMISEQWFVLVQERLVLPEASTERVWSWELQVDVGQEPFSPTGTDGRDDGGARHEDRGGRLEALAVRTVAVVWRRSPWRSSGGARREVHGSRLEALAAGGGKAGSRAAQRMQNEGRRRRSWRRRPAWRRRWPGGPGGVQPGRGGMEGQVAAPHPGLEAAIMEVLEATAGLEAEANLEVLKSVGL